MKRQTATGTFAAVLVACGLAICAQAQNLVGNGDFSLEPIGKTSLAMNANNDNYFRYWRVYSVSSTNGSNFRATIVTNPASPGNPAVQMDYSRVGARALPSEDWTFGLGTGADRAMPVAFRKSYYLSFDAAYVGGASNVLVIFPEFKDNHAFVGLQYAKNVTVASPVMQRYVIAWTPLTNATVEAGLSFQPQLTGLGAETNSSIIIDNVQLVEAGYEFNGGFEAEPVGTTVTKSGTGAVTDNATFTYWRLNANNLTNGSSLRGTIVTNPATGGAAMRLDLDKSGGGTSGSLDRDWTGTGTTTANGVIPGWSRIAVTPGASYVVSFDAAWVSGSTSLQVVYPEYRSNHGFVGQQFFKNVTVTNTAMQRYSFFWVPQNTANYGTNMTVEIGSNFQQLMTGTNLTSSMIIDNVQLTPYGPLVGNGSFEAEAVGTTATCGGAGNVINTTTFSGWRVYSVATSGTRDDLVATLVPNATDGNVAMQLNWTARGGVGPGFALDNDNTRNPYVTYGTYYNIMFDVAYVSGSTKFAFALPEFNSNGVFTSSQSTYNLSMNNTAYQTVTITNWTPINTLADRVKVTFVPQASGTTNTSVFLFDNIRFAKAATNVTWSGLSRTYDGLPKAAVATTTPAGLGVTPTYNGLCYAPLNAGSYTAVAAISDPAYLALSPAVTNTFVINKAVAVVTLSGLTNRFDGLPKTPAVNVTPPGLTVDLTYDGSPTAPYKVGKYQVIGAVNNLNYAGSATNQFVITASPGLMIRIQ
jgi:hypothetical protein